MVRPKKTPEERKASLAKHQAAKARREKENLAWAEQVLERNVKKHAQYLVRNNRCNTKKYRENTEHRNRQKQYSHLVAKNRQIFIRGRTTSDLEYIMEEWGIEKMDEAVKVAIHHFAQETREGLTELKGQVDNDPRWDFL